MQAPALPVQQEDFHDPIIYIEWKIRILLKEKAISCKSDLKSNLGFP